MVLNLAACHFTRVADPVALAGHLREWAEAGELRGTVLVAGEGVNLSVAGAADAVQAFLRRLRGDARFADIRSRFSESRAQPFARLKVKIKPEIISFRCERSSPLGARAPSVAPADLARWLDQGHDDAGAPVVLLDTHNREEVGHGSFAGALALPIDNFTDLPRALTPHREALANATVVSFCTGGIRCEKAALWMRGEGMGNVLQLDGGILGYFEQVGGAHYHGRCFVFDERVALDPQMNPLAERIPVTASSENLEKWT
jgi:UPF0176 protein